MRRTLPMEALTCLGQQFLTSYVHECSQDGERYRDWAHAASAPHSCFIPGARTKGRH